jgi:hypothetical protein
MPLLYNYDDEDVLSSLRPPGDAHRRYKLMWEIKKRTPPSVGHLVCDKKIACTGEDNFLIATASG